MQLVEKRPTRLCRNVQPILRTSRDMEVVINLLQFIVACAPTLNAGIDTSSKRSKGLLHLRTGIGLCGAWHDARDR